MRTSKQPLIVFPDDEGPHKEPFEWWYWNMNLSDANGKSYSAMFTLFRARPPACPDMWSTHEIVACAGREKAHPQFHMYAGVDRAVWEKTHFDIGVNRRFRMEKTTSGAYEVVTPDMHLRMTPVKPPILIGGTGLVDLGISKSFYYTLPRMEASGTIRVGAKRIAVSGLAWMDHQWHPFTISRETVWKWFSVHLSDGTDVQCFEFGKTNIVRLVTVSHPDGTQSSSSVAHFVPVGEAWVSPDTRLPYQLDWRVMMSDLKMDLTFRPEVHACEAIFGPVIYWEGSMNVTGKVNGRDVTGLGFFEYVPNADIIISMQAILRNAKNLAERKLRAFGKQFSTRAG
jgi:predicted secreted hydrolase